jgi:tetratricopeptide (TPR) repeat protein
MNRIKHVFLSRSVALLLMLSPLMVQAEDNSAWSNSYQLEAAAQYAQAITALDGVVLNGADAELKSLRRGWLYYLLGSYNESIREYRYANERNAKSVDARLGIVLPLLAQQRWREAEMYANLALELSPNNYTALLRVTLAQEGLGDWEKMEKSAERMTVAYPTDVSAFVYLARAKAWLNKKSEALAAYRAVLVRFPGHLEATAYLEKP